MSPDDPQDDVDPLEEAEDVRNRLGQEADRAVEQFDDGIVELLAWVLDTDRRAGAGYRYGAVLAGVQFLPGWLGAVDITVGNLLVGLVAIGLFSVVAVRLYLLPGLVVAGRPVWTALAESRRRSFGVGWTLYGLIVVFGLGSWALALVPVAGGFLSTVLVAPAQAVSIGVILRQTGALAAEG